jgi:membrane protease subunit HflK
MNKILKMWVSLKSPWDDDSTNDKPTDNDNIFTKARRKGSNFPLKDMKFNFTPNIVSLVFAGLLLVWVASGIYEIKEGEEAIVVRFGKFVRKGTAGLNYRMPYPIEYSVIEKVNQSRRIEIGYRSGIVSRGSTGATKEMAVESTMLTGDENI